LVVLAVGLGSYAFRVSMLVVAGRAGLPPVLDRATRFVVPVAFASLAATAVAEPARLQLSSLAPAAALAVAVVATRRTGSAPAALLAGMPTLWLLSALLPSS
jgi:branched-subunit amino acid transport protein